MRTRLGWLAVCVSPLLFGTAQAAGEAGRPASFGDLGPYRLPSAYVPASGKAWLSLFRENRDRDPKDLDISYHGLGFSLGASPRLELFGSAVLQVRVNADALAQPGYYGELPFVGTRWSTGRGDLRLGAKYQLLDDRRSDVLALAFRGAFKLPTASAEAGLGSGRPSASADLVLSTMLERRLTWSGTLGFELSADNGAARVPEAWKWGVGLDWEISRRTSVQVEMSGARFTNLAGQTNPADLVVGLAYWPRPNVFVRGGVSRNLAFDDRGLGSRPRSYTGFHVSIGWQLGPPSLPPEPALAAPAATDLGPLECQLGEFAWGSAQLVHASEACAEGLALRLKPHPRLAAVLLGWVEPGESQSADLGLERAQAVREYLVRKGIAADRVVAASAGSGAGPRRVEVLFVIR